MSKGKLAKFADMASYPHVFEYPFAKLEEAACPLRGRWHAEVFGNTNPIVLELGCGRGEYAVGLARRYPECNFVGVDIKGARMWTGATESLREGLKNVAFLRTNIELIHRCFAPGEVAELWLTFSDPQMKKPTKRLTSTFFLQRYRQFLADGGIVHLKTDSNFLFTYTKYVTEVNHLPVEVCTDDLYNGQWTMDNVHSSFDLAIRTYYEQQWLARGISIKYLRFRLPHEGALVEPDVEIPLDDYRSYNRDKRSSLLTSK